MAAQLQNGLHIQNYLKKLTTLIALSSSFYFETIIPFVTFFKMAAKKFKMAAKIQNGHQIKNIFTKLDHCTYAVLVLTFK